MRETVRMDVRVYSPDLLLILLGNVSYFDHTIDDVWGESLRNDTGIQTSWIDFISFRVVDDK
jgi:hypothetical protein